MDFTIRKQQDTNKVRLGDIVKKRSVNNNISLDDINLIANPKKMTKSDDERSVGSFNSADERSVMDAVKLGGSFQPTSLGGIGEVNSEGDSDDDSDDSSDFENINDEGSMGDDEVSINSDDSSDMSINEDAQSVAVSEPTAPKSYDQILKEKQEILFKIERLGKYGLHPTKRLTMASSLEEIEYEYKKLRRSRDVESSIKFQRKVLIALSSGVEFLNNKFDPIDAKLDGWSENIMENITDYDEVFEELYDKYNTKVKMAPELKLLMMVGGSAVMYHLSNTLFKSNVPGLNDILKSNPDIMRSISQAAVRSMGGMPGGDMGGARMAPPSRPSTRPSGIPVGGAAPRRTGGDNVDSILRELNVSAPPVRNTGAPVNFDELSSASESERNTIRSSISKRNGRREMNLNF